MTECNRIILEETKRWKVPVLPGVASLEGELSHGIVVNGGAHVVLLGEVGGVNGDNCRECTGTHSLRQEAT